MTPWVAALACAAAAPVACLSGEEVDLGRNVDAGATRGDDASAGDDGPGLGQPVPTPFLSGAISATMGTICAGACVDLVATVSGGTGPFAYSWGQGLGEGRGPKSVCPAATTTYSVMISSLSSEQQSTPSAMVTVVACDGGTTPTPADGGSTPQGDAGSAVPQTANLCVPNPSLEGQAIIGTSGPPGTPATGAPPQWQVCQGAPDVGPSVSLLPASDGNTYEGLAVGTGSLAYMTASIGTTLCAPLVTGTQYSFCVDLGIGVRGVMAPLTTGTTTPAPALQLWGGTAACNQDALLWTSPPITNTDSWMKVCGAFVAPLALTTITLLPAEGSAPVGPGSWSYVIVDDITAGP
jgi:hypothetical protein